jgi:hypothetical protein
VAFNNRATAFFGTHGFEGVRSRRYEAIVALHGLARLATMERRLP